MSETHWLQGREAALNGKPREKNPYGMKNGWAMWDDGWLHGDAEKNPTGPWVVNVIGDEATGQDIEISIVLNTNKHGQESYGWDGDEKVIVWSDGGPCNYRIARALFIRMMFVARETCVEMNRPGADLSQFIPVSWEDEEAAQDQRSGRSRTAQDQRSG